MFTLPLDVLPPDRCLATVAMAGRLLDDGVFSFEVIRCLISDRLFGTFCFVLVVTGLVSLAKRWFVCSSCVLLSFLVSPGTPSALRGSGRARDLLNRWSRGLTGSALDFAGVFVPLATASDVTPSRCRKESNRNSAEHSRGFLDDGHFRKSKTDFRFPSRSCSRSSSPSSSSSSPTSFAVWFRFQVPFLGDLETGFWKGGVE